MTQTATVTAVPKPGLVEVTVARQTACGHDCENCAGCGVQAGAVTVLAATELTVVPGDRVELYSSSGKVLPIAALYTWHLWPCFCWATCSPGRSRDGAGHWAAPSALQPALPGRLRWIVTCAAAAAG